MQLSLYLTIDFKLHGFIPHIFVKVETTTLRACLAFSSNKSPIHYLLAISVKDIVKREKNPEETHSPFQIDVQILENRLQYATPTYS
jgi:hypothetical protein